MNSYLAAFRKYADFASRARRREYWTFALVTWIGFVVIAKVGSLLLSPGSAGERVLIGFLVCLMFGLVIPNISVSVRRLHDVNRSGWWLLIGVIPVFGAIVLLVFALTPGTVGGNPYGLDPKLVDLPAPSV